MIIPELCCDEDDQRTLNSPSKQGYAYFSSRDVSAVLDSPNLETFQRSHHRPGPLMIIVHGR